MKRMIGLIVLLGVVAHTGAFACMCAWSPPWERAERAPIIFSGTVIDMTTSSERFTYKVGDHERESTRTIATHVFAVGAVWLGEPVDTLIVKSTVSTSCGYKFPAATEMFVYTWDRYGEIWSGMCSGNQPVESAIFDRYWFGEPTFLADGYSLQAVTLEDLFEELSSSGTEQQRSAIQGLGALARERPEVYTELRTIVESGGFGVQAAAIEALGAMGEGASDAVPALEQALRAPSSEVRVAALGSLLRIVGYDKYYDYLLLGLGDDSEQVQISAAMSAQCMKACLSPMEQKAVANQLAPLLGSESSTVRGHAVLALRACGTAASPFIGTLELMAEYDENKWVRISARGTLREFGTNPDSD